MVEAPENRLLARLQLVAFLSSHDQGNFWNFLAPSLAIFWPHANVVAVLEDTAEEHEFAAKLPRGYKVHYTHRFLGMDRGGRSDAVHPRERMQLLKFYADEFSTADYIGYVDSDTLFTTWVTQGSLFDNRDRPRMIVEVGRPKTSWYSKVPKSTQAFLLRPEQISCMSQFPQIYLRDHVRMIRKHLEHIHRAEFGTLSRRLYPRMHPMAPSFVEFNIMCNYLLHHHFDDYAFFFQELDPNWTEPLPFGQEPVNRSWLQWRPAVRVAIHGGYMGRQDEKTKCSDALPLKCRWFPLALEKMREGLCRSVFARRLHLNSRDTSIAHPLCNDSKPLNSQSIHYDLFRFEFILSWDWVSTDQYGCVAAQQNHYAEVARERRGPNSHALQRMFHLARLGDALGSGPNTHRTFAESRSEISSKSMCARSGGQNDLQSCSMQSDPADQSDDVAICIGGRTELLRRTANSIREHVLEGLGVHSDVFVYSSRRTHIPVEISTFVIASKEDLDEEKHALDLLLKQGRSMDTIHGERRFRDATAKPRSALIHDLIVPYMQLQLLQLVENHEKQRRQKYAWIMWMRPDMLWISKHLPISDFEPNHCHIPAGEDWGGLNDRYALCCRRHAATYLGAWRFLENTSLQVSRWLEHRGPFLLGAHPGLLEFQFNPERLLQVRLEYGNVQVARFAPKGYLVHETPESHQTHQTSAGPFEFGLHPRYLTEEHYARQVVEGRDMRVKSIELQFHTRFQGKFAFKVIRGSNIKVSGNALHVALRLPQHPIASQLPILWVGNATNFGCLVRVRSGFLAGDSRSVQVAAFPSKLLSCKSSYLAMWNNNPISNFVVYLQTSKAT